MDGQLLPLAHSNILTNYIAFEVVDEIVDLQDAKLDFFHHLTQQPLARKEPFSPQGTLGLVVNDLCADHNQLDDPNFKINVWKDLDKTNTPYAFLVNSLVLDLVDLVQRTRGYVKGVIANRAEDIAQKINDELLKTSPFSSASVLQDIGEGSCVGKGICLPPPVIEEVNWGDLENVALISTLLDEVRTQYNLTLEGTPSQSWINVLERLLYLPITDLTDQETALLGQAIEREMGEPTPPVVNIFSNNSGYAALITGVFQSLYCAPQILDILDQLRVLKNIGSALLLSQGLSTRITEHIQSVLSRIDIMLLCVHISRVTFFGKSYVLTAIKNEPGGYTLLINGDQTYVGNELGITPKEAYDVFLYLRYEKDRMLPASGIETSFVGEKKDKAIVWLLEKAAEAAKNEETDIKNAFGGTAYRILVQESNRFIQENKYAIHHLSVEEKCKQACIYMEANPQDCVLIIMNLLLSYTPHRTARLLVSCYSNKDDVLKPTITKSSAILANFVKEILNGYL